MELHFIAATLHVVREAVAVRAARAGMAQERVSEVALAVHELAANAVRHGAGWGRLQIARMHISSQILPYSLIHRPWPRSTGHGAPPEARCC